jgi:cellulose synthase/poly-beta-1,6-N-acetylglucosamine synthase-like glycosyltransferase
LSSYRIEVVIDEGDEDVCATVQALKDWLGGTELVQLLVVPGDYHTPRGARYKTRANHYALEHRRARGENTSSTYVYHLDDDTSMGVDTVASIAEFIAGNRNGEHLLAQGVLAFPNELSPSWLSNMADSIRPADDLTRFNLFTETFGVPLGGLHGEHLLVRADIEDDIGWDYPDTVIEDALFALHFATRYPGRSTTLNSFSYGASPATITDLVKQRRRWSEGLLKLIFKRDIPLLSRLPLMYCVLGLGQLTIPVCRPFVATVVHPRPQRCLPGTFLGDRPMELQPRVPALELCARVPDKQRSFGQTEIALVLPRATGDHVRPIRYRKLCRTARPAPFTAYRERATGVRGDLQALLTLDMSQKPRV